MKYRIAQVFSSGTEYEIFRDNYCDNDCVFHKEREDGFTDLSRMAVARLKTDVKVQDLTKKHFRTCC